METMDYKEVVVSMEQTVLDNLSNLEKGFGRRKWSIARQTEIPDDILTVILKRLKWAGYIEIIMIWSEKTGRPDGSGYCLAQK